MKLIINADDLGYNSSVTKAIFDLMAQGLVTSATLMANSPHVDGAVREIRQFPGCSFGAHLNLTEFRPLRPSAALGVLLDEGGNFVSERIREVRVTQGLSRAIFEEFCAQIEKLHGMGVKVSHIDSHHHVHTVPSLFFVLKRVQKKFGIRKVRITRNLYETGERPPRFLMAKKRLYNFFLKHYDLPTKTTEGFSDFLSFYERALSRELSYHTYEVMVHPGNAGYEKETSLLRTDCWRKKVELSLDLINYDQL